MNFWKNLKLDSKKIMKQYYVMQKVDNIYLMASLLGVI